MPPARGSGWLVVLAVTLAGLWAVGATVAFQGVGWLVEQVLLATEVTYPAAVWPLITAGNALVVAAAVLPTLLIKRPRLRAVARTWSVAVGFLALLGLLRAIPAVPRIELYAAALTLVAGVLAALLALVTRGAARPAGSRFAGLLAATATGLAVLLPWCWLGALGSPLETGLTVLAALAVGALAGVLLSRVLWPAFTDPPLGRWAHVVVGGLAAGVALALLVAGAGPPGAQLVLLVSVPPLGFALAALAHPAAVRWPAGAVPVALAVAGALVFVDPEELTILLGTGDIGRAALLGALAAAGIALLAAVPLTLAGTVPARSPWPVLRRVAAAGTAVVLAAAGTVVYAAAGQPGFHGERLFVILASQADLTGLAEIEDIDERRTETYRRLVDHAEESQRDLRAELADRDVEYRPYYLVNAVEVPADPVLRRWLDGRDDVDRVLDSPRLRPLPFDLPVSRGTATEAPAQPVWNLEMIGAPAVWAQGIDGRGLVLGESDSGVDARHPALRDNYRGRTGGDDYNWYDPWHDTASPEDAAGHGTHTTATAVGRQNVGVAPGAEWIGCANLARNLGNPAFYLDCLQFMLAPFPRDGDPFRDGDPERAADVLNNSWGCPELEGCDAGSLHDAARALRAAGIFVAVSAGNSGDRCETVRDPLALYPEAFAVGSVNRDGEVSRFSSRGPVTVDGSGRDKPDIAAPGEDIVSALPEATYGPNEGTSMAGPHVAGVVLLMWSANPDLVGDVDRTADLMRQTARPATATFRSDGEECGGQPNLSGAGIVDAAAAVEAATGAGTRR
jgi:subtilisin family serine protease